eukprot:jgi/Mesvir1/20897/Mv07971-RA.1
MSNLASQATICRGLCPLQRENSGRICKSQLLVLRKRHPASALARSRQPIPAASFASKKHVSLADASARRNGRLLLMHIKSPPKRLRAVTKASTAADNIGTPTPTKDGFQPDLAILLGTFAFDAYNTPELEKGWREIDSTGTQTFYLSRDLVSHLFQGILKLKLVSATGLPAPDIWKGDSVYATFRLVESFAKSHVINRKGSAEVNDWNDELCLYVPRRFPNQASRFVFVAVHGQGGLVQKNPRLGVGRIPVEAILRGLPQNLTLQLEDGQGTLQLRAELLRFPGRNYRDSLGARVADPAEVKAAWLAQDKNLAAADDRDNATVGLVDAEDYEKAALMDGEVIPVRTLKLGAEDAEGAGKDGAPWWAIDAFAPAGIPLYKMLDSALGAFLLANKGEEGGKGENGMDGSDGDGKSSESGKLVGGEAGKEDASSSSSQQQGLLDKAKELFTAGKAQGSLELVDDVTAATAERMGQAIARFASRGSSSSNNDGSSSSAGGGNSAGDGSEGGRPIEAGAWGASGGQGSKGPDASGGKIDRENGASGGAGGQSLTDKFLAPRRSSSLSRPRSGILAAALDAVTTGVGSDSSANGSSGAGGEGKEVPRATEVAGDGSDRAAAESGSAGEQGADGGGKKALLDAVVPSVLSVFGVGEKATGDVASSSDQAAVESQQGMGAGGSGKRASSDMEQPEGAVEALATSAKPVASSIEAVKRLPEASIMFGLGLIQKYVTDVVASKVKGEEGGSGRSVEGEGGGKGGAGFGAGERVSAAATAAVAGAVAGAIMAENAERDAGADASKLAAAAAGRTPKGGAAQGDAGGGDGGAAGALVKRSGEPGSQGQPSLFDVSLAVEDLAKGIEGLTNQVAGSLLEGVPWIRPSPSGDTSGDSAADAPAADASKGAGSSTEGTEEEKAQAALDLAAAARMLQERLFGARSSDEESEEMATELAETVPGGGALEDAAAEAARMAEAWRVLARTCGKSVGGLFPTYEQLCFIENEDTDTQASIWWDKRARHIVIAFRGTEQVRWKDFVTDVLLLPVDLNPERVSASKNEGLFQLPFAKGRDDKRTSDAADEMEPKVHFGFLRAFDSVKPAIFRLLRGILSTLDYRGTRGRPWHLYITGHSLGGALATLCAWEVRKSAKMRERISAMTMYNYGSPRVGDQCFADAYDSAVPDSWRIVNEMDVIPRVPRLLGFKHVGQVVSLNQNGQLDWTSLCTSDMIGEVTPEGLLNNLSGREIKAIEDLTSLDLDRVKVALDKLVEAELLLLSSITDGSALRSHMETLYFASLESVLKARSREVRQ